MAGCGRCRSRDERPTPRQSGEWGVSSVDLIVALGVVAIVAGLVVPGTAEVIDASRARHAAGFMATRFRQARLQAIAETRSVGLVFDLVSGRWTFQLCTDGNGNGVRRADLSAGDDRCTGDVYDVTHLFPGMAIGVDPQLPGPAGEPGSGDPVRFGQSDILSFSANGTCTAGTLFLQSDQGTQYAVRISNVTTRTRVLRYERGTRQWVPA
jgi:type II secretory pathway pseudopilin PulG